MCTLYTLRLSAWEVRNLMQHYKLVGREWEEVIGRRNDAQEFYPNHEVYGDNLDESGATIRMRRGGRLKG